MGNFSYDYPRPGLTSDVVLFRFVNDTFEILLIERGDYPFIGSWALPGGFVDEGETAEVAANRELLEETGIRNVKLQQVYTTTTPNRDPRGWTVSVIFTGFVSEHIIAVAGDDARNTAWFPIKKIPEMAFDHKEAVQNAIEKLRENALFKLFGYEVLTTSFHPDKLTKIYEQLALSVKQISFIIERLKKHKVLLEEQNNYHFSAKNIDRIMNEGFV